MSSFNKTNPISDEYNTSHVITKKQSDQGTIVTSGFPRAILDSVAPADINSEIHRFFDEVDKKHSSYLVVRNAFSADEIERINAYCAFLGYENLEGIYDPNYRNNDRIMVDDPTFASEWFRRLLPHIEKLQRDMSEQGHESLESLGASSAKIVNKYDRTDNVVRSVHWKDDPPIGLNNLLRCCRYPPNGIFGMHKDAHVSLLPVSISKLTVMAYMNDIPEENKGATRFFVSEPSTPSPSSSTTGNRPQASRTSGRGPQMVVASKVQPEAGLVVIFPHVFPHDGELCLHSEKIIIRSDVMFSTRELSCM